MISEEPVHETAKLLTPVPIYVVSMYHCGVLSIAVIEVLARKPRYNATSTIIDRLHADLHSVST